MKILVSFDNRDEVTVNCSSMALNSENILYALDEKDKIVGKWHWDKVVGYCKLIEKE